MLRELRSALALGIEQAAFPQHSRETAGLILAAGRGTRFGLTSPYPPHKGGGTGEAMPKVLRPLLGRPMVSYVIETMRAAGVDELALVAGYRADDVIRALGDGLAYVVQDQQRGSGDAVKCATEHFMDFDGALVVMCGDSPLFRTETVRAMIDERRDSGAVAVLASAVLDDPTGYGRIVRSRSGAIARIVEEKCASDKERAIKEVNGGAYVFDSQWLFANIDWMVENQAGEYNLTDMARLAIEQGKCVSAMRCDPEEILGVNTAEELRLVEGILLRRAS